MYKNLLPIGSVVMINGAARRMMICGRVVSRGQSGEIYDYVGCLYPEGIVSSSNLYFFNRDVIADCVQRGFEDEEELSFRENILDPLGDVEIVDGKIVPKNPEQEG